MKIPVIACFAIVMAAAAPAREPAETLADLKKLETMVSQVAAKSMPATVALVSEKTGSSGSGVLVSADGLILTAAHVVQGMKEVDVYFNDGKKWLGKVLGANYSKDIGMVKMVETGPWPFVEIGESKPLVAGDWVLALGHSAGFDPARTPPVRFGRVMSDGPGNYFTTDCTLIGGDSGGPLFGIDGKLVGINSSIGESWKNNNHAGVDGFREDWDKLKAGETWGTLQMNPLANPETPVLGIGMGMVMERGVKGVPVQRVDPNSPAAAAGVRVGDVISSVDGEPVREGADLQQVLVKREVGDTVKLGIVRESEHLEIGVALVKREELYKSFTPSSPTLSGDSEVPLMLPNERKVVETQSNYFNKGIEPLLSEAAKSTVLIWGKDRQPRELVYGTVVGNGTQVITKWSEIEAYADTLFVQNGAGDAAKAVVAGVFTDEDLALLDLTPEPGAAQMSPAKFSDGQLTLGAFLVAARPNGKPGAFGVVGVLERNLRETDQAHLGIMADQDYRGEGVRIANVQPEYGAAEAGIQAGDVILKIGDRKISGLQELKNAMSGKHPGDMVTLIVDSAGKERAVEVRLSNRPVLGQFSGDRLNQMEGMGGRPNRVRDGFSRVVQSDMQIQSNRVGGPVVDLQGRIVGITMARADRTRTYIMASTAVMDVLKEKLDTVAEAKAKTELRKQELAEQNRALLPKMRALGKPRDPQRMRRHIGDMERLIERMNREMDDLGER